jgi:hypothetical protein
MTSRLVPKAQMEDLEEIIEIFAKELTREHTDSQADALQHIKDAYVICQEECKKKNGSYYEPRD